MKLIRILTLMIILLYLYRNINMNIVRIGANNLKRPENEHKDYRIDEFISHPGYNSAKQINDVALIRVVNDIR
jgi:hypothetical protein